MARLDLNSILGEQEIDTLFEEPKNNSTQESVDGSGDKPDNIDNDGTITTTEVVSPDDLFDDEVTKQPESVGSEKTEEAKEDAVPDKGGDTSPNFYSSIANALAVDGIFPNSDEESVKKVDSAESLSDLIEAEINARFDEKQQKLLKALENGVEPSELKNYESTLNYIDSITDAQLSEEGERGEQLRQRIIYQDYINKGYTPERAQKLTERTINAGTDIEDAKDALISNKDYFQKKYDKLLKDAQDEADKQRAERQKQEAKMKESIMKDKNLLGDMEVSNDVRKKVYDCISKPIYKDPETGQYMTAIQKYESENHADFIKYVGLFYTITDGFKDFKSFAKAEVNKEKKKVWKELEQTLSNTRRNSDGTLNMVGGRKDDPESFFDGSFKLAL